MTEAAFLGYLVWTTLVKQLVGPVAQFERMSERARTLAREVLAEAQ